MQVICKNCGKLVQEEVAIKMSVADFKSFQMTKMDLEGCSFFENEHHQYTQICKLCYDKKEW